MIDRLRHGISRRFVPSPFAALAALFILTWVAVFWLAHDKWRDRETAAFQLAGNEASQSEARIHRLIHDADQILLGLRAMHPDGGMAADLAHGDPGGGSGGIALLAPDGHVRAGTAHANTAGWPNLMARLMAPDDILALGEPVPGRNGQPSLLPVARRMTGPDGAFAGILMLSLDVDALSRVPDAMAFLERALTELLELRRT